MKLSVTAKLTVVTCLAYFSRLPTVDVAATEDRDDGLEFLNRPPLELTGQDDHGSTTSNTFTVA